MWKAGYQEGWVWGSDLGGVVVYLVGLVLLRRIWMRMEEWRMGAEVDVGVLCVVGS